MPALGWTMVGTSGLSIFLIESVKGPVALTTTFALTSHSSPVILSFIRAPLTYSFVTPSFSTYTHKHMYVNTLRRTMLTQHTDSELSLLHESVS